MTTEELKYIVKSSGGTKAFSQLIGATPRAVTSWMTGQRKMKPTTEKLIRILHAAKIDTQSAK